MSDPRITLLQQKLDEHIDDFNRHREEEDKRWDQLLQITHENSQNIASLAKSTHDVVEAWDTANSVVKAGSLLGSFIKWLSGFGVVAIAATWIIEHWPKS